MRKTSAAFAEPEEDAVKTLLPHTKHLPVESRKALETCGRPGHKSVTNRTVREAAALGLLAFCNIPATVRLLVTILAGRPVVLVALYHPHNEESGYRTMASAAAMASVCE